jgi:hypothetical protein
MASARFRLGFGTSSTGPWTWAAYDSALQVTAGDYVKVQLESTSSVNLFQCEVYSADPDEYDTAGLPTVTVDAASKTAVFQTRSAAANGFTFLVKVSINGGTITDSERSRIATANYTKTGAAYALTVSGNRLIATAEKLEVDATHGWLPALNAVIKNGGGCAPVTSQAKWVWVRPVFDYALVPYSTSQVQLLTDFSNILPSGMAIRTLSNVGVLLDVNEAFSDAAGLTGISLITVDARGRLYVVLSHIEVPPSHWIVNVYNNPDLAEGHKVAYSGWIHVPGTIVLYSHNNSGIAGAVHIDSLLQTTAIFEFFRWHVCKTCTSTTLTLDGPALPSGLILGLWYGALGSQVEVIDLPVGGAYALEASEQLLLDSLLTRRLWRKGPARAVKLCLRAEGVNESGGPTVNFLTTGDGDMGGICTGNSGAGLTVSSAQTQFETTIDIDPAKYELVNGSFYELQTSIGDANDQYLTAQVVVVLE